VTAERSAAASEPGSNRWGEVAARPAARQARRDHSARQARRDHSARQARQDLVPWGRPARQGHPDLVPWGHRVRWNRDHPARCLRRPDLPGYRARHLARRGRGLGRVRSVLQDARGRRVHRGRPDPWEGRQAVRPEARQARQAHQGRRETRPASRDQPGVAVGREVVLPAGAVSPAVHPDVEEW